jgi:hypothetical protein
MHRCLPVPNRHSENTVSRCMPAATHAHAALRLTLSMGPSQVAHQQRPDPLAHLVGNGILCTEERRQHCAANGGPKRAALDAIL